MNGDMRYLLLPFFLCVLVPTVALSMIKITLTRVSFLASGLGCLLFLTYVLMFQPGLPTSPSWARVTTPTTSTVKNLPIISDTAQYQREFEVWQKLYQLQPTHRDILLNLALLSELLGNQQNHDKYRLEAQRLDPNNAVFSTR